MDPVRQPKPSAGLPTEEEWKEWREHPVTRAFSQMVLRWREELRDQIEDGVTEMRACPTLEEKVLLLVEMGGNVAVLRQIIDLDYGRFVSAMED